jgi:hypothetical protein
MTRRAIVVLVSIDFTKATENCLTAQRWLVMHTNVAPIWLSGRVQ